jgi:hypothetical protein
MRSRLRSRGDAEPTRREIIRTGNVSARARGDHTRGPGPVPCDRGRRARRGRGHDRLHGARRRALRAWRRVRHCRCGSHRRHEPARDWRHSRPAQRGCLGRSLKDAITPVASCRVWAARIAGMLCSFSYLAFRALLGLLVRSRRGPGVKDIELMILRHELDVLHRQISRPADGPADRAFLAVAACHLPRSAKPLLLVTPRTLLRWHPALVRRKWRQDSNRPGRPRLSAEIQELGRRLRRTAFLHRESDRRGGQHLARVRRRERERELPLWR